MKTHSNKHIKKAKLEKNPLQNDVLQPVQQNIAPIIKKDLILREYQVTASDYVMQHRITVLGMAPNGGKTEVSIDVIRRFLQINPRARVLVLTHSTHVLKDNYTDRLDSLFLPFEYSTTFERNKQVHICLPHSEKYIVGKYDLIIVDEAHENYLEERVQRIIEKSTPDKLLLLTGTPSKFIKAGGYNIHTVAANAIPVEYFAKLQIELVVSNYSWNKSINQDYEIKSQYKFKTGETEKTLENILLKLIERVRMGLNAEEFNNPNLITKLKSWAYTYKKLGKTIIVCKRVLQATDVYNILTANGVKVTVSDSETDTKNVEIDKFKKNEFDVLIVVNRTRLGYSDSDLYNIIDMSGTHNPNMIYQIFARALRGTPSMQKYYLKVTTQEYGMMDFTRACVNAALMLTDDDFLSTFNGSNFKGIKIPVIKKSYEFREKDDEKGEGGKGHGGGQKFMFPEFTNDVIEMFKKIKHDLKQPVSIYRLVTIAEVRAKMENRNVWTMETILATITGEY